MNAQPQPAGSAATNSSPSLLPGVNVLIEGPTGTGKTHSIGTLVDTGIEVFYLALESGMESLLGYWTDRGLEVPPNLRWNHLKASEYGFSSMIASATQISQLTADGLAKVQDLNKSKYNQFIQLLQLLADFHDQRTDAKFGDVHKWGPDKVLIVDALTGVNHAVMSMVAGTKPVKSFVDYGAAMDQIERFIKELCENCRCHFVLIAHIERETDEVLGGSKITVGTIGKKLAPRIPPLFSDVILSRREGAKFYWSTSNALADLKTRNLELREDIPPNFALILNKWKSRGGRFTPEVKK